MKALDFLTEAVENSQKRYDNELERLRYNKERYEFFIEKVKEVAPKFEEALRKQGLEIENFYCGKTGTNSDWRAEDYMHCSVSAKPFNNKIKFVESIGFNKSRDGRNHLQLTNKADRLRVFIKNETRLESISVNQYCFEIKEKGKKNSILIDFWIE